MRHVCAQALHKIVCVCLASKAPGAAGLCGRGSRPICQCIFSPLERRPPIARTSGMISPSSVLTGATGALSSKHDHQTSNSWQRIVAGYSSLSDGSRGRAAKIAANLASVLSCASLFGSGGGAPPDRNITFPVIGLTSARRRRRLPGSWGLRIERAFATRARTGKSQRQARRNYRITCIME